MTWYNEEYVKLMEEVAPWQYYDPDTEEFKFKEGTPEVIIEKHLKAKRIYDKLPKSWTF